MLVDGPTSQGQDAPPPVQDPPSHLYITSYLRSPPEYDLRWVAQDSGGLIDHFIVYQSLEPITAENRSGAARSTVAGSARSLVVELQPDTGTRFFRVSEVDTAGQEGPLSPEYAVDTTSRVAFLVNRAANETKELYVTLPSEGTPERVNTFVRTGGEIWTDFAWSPDGRRLAWRADTDAPGVMELYVAPGDAVLAPMKASGPLVPTAEVTKFAWSPDATALAFIADRERDSVFELYVTPAAGTATPMKVSAPMTRRGAEIDGVRDFAWSPDGTRLAYTANDRFQDVEELTVATADGGSRLRVSGSVQASPGFTGVTQFAWSPDGQVLAYLADKVLPGVWEVYTVSPSGGRSVKVSGSLAAGGKVHEFAWSPASDRLAFLAERYQAGRPELFTAPAGGGLIINVSASLVAGGQVLPGFRWSRLADAVAFRATKDSPDVTGLYAAATSGDQVFRLSGAPLPGSTVEDDFAWSPDSESVAARLIRGLAGNAQLYHLRAANAALQLVNVPLPTDRNVEQFAWSPDGRHVAYIADQRMDDRFELYANEEVLGGVTRNISAPESVNGDVRGAVWSPLSN